MKVREPAGRNAERHWLVSCQPTRSEMALSVLSEMSHQLWRSPLFLPPCPQTFVFLNDERLDGVNSPWDRSASIALRVALTVCFSMHWLKEAVDSTKREGEADGKVESGVLSGKSRGGGRRSHLQAWR